MIGNMIRYFALVGLVCLALAGSVRAQGVDEKYVGIYHLIQQADTLNDRGDIRGAVSRYLEAQKELQNFQEVHPDWNPRIVKFRLEYLAARLQPLTPKVADTNVAPAAVVQAPAATPGSSLTNQLMELQEEIKRLTGQNVLLEARLKEALSVQPAPMDPRELMKAEAKIKDLEKERDLLKVALDQQKTTAMKLTDTTALEAERKLMTEIRQKLDEQTKQNAALLQENMALKKQIADMKPQLEMPIGEKNELASQLQIAKATITSLQATNLVLRDRQIALERQVADLSRQPTNTTVMPAELQRQLQLAQARLEVYEARQVPYTPEELALLKQPDKKISLAQTNLPVARKPRELPAGAAPLMAEAERAIDAARFEDAEKKLLDILRQDEKNSYVLVRLAGVQMEQNRLPEAEQTLNRAMAVDSQDPVGLYLLGRLKFQQEQYDAALDSLSMAAKVLPDEARTQYFLGKVLLQKGMRAQGETALRRAVNLRPGWGEAHYSLAMVYATAQPPFGELAQWHYQKALAGGYPRNQDFERMLQQKTTAKVP